MTCSASARACRGLQLPRSAIVCNKLTGTRVILKVTAHEGRTRPSKTIRGVSGDHGEGAWADAGSTIRAMTTQGLEGFVHDVIHNTVHTGNGTDPGGLRFLDANPVRCTQRTPASTSYVEQEPTGRGTRARDRYERQTDGSDRQRTLDWRSGSLRASTAHARRRGRQNHSLLTDAGDRPAAAPEAGSALPVWVPFPPGATARSGSRGLPITTCDTGWSGRYSAVYTRGTRAPPPRATAAQSSTQIPQLPTCPSRLVMCALFSHDTVSTRGGAIETTSAQIHSTHVAPRRCRRASRSRSRSRDPTMRRLARCR